MSLLRLRDMTLVRLRRPLRRRVHVVLLSNPLQTLCEQRIRLPNSWVVVDNVEPKGRRLCRKCDHELAERLISVS